MNDVAPPDAAGTGSALPKGALGAWWWQGARTAFLLRPRWDALSTTPAVVALLLVVPFALGVLVERLYIVGPAMFHWPALATGWISSLVMLWTCWLLLNDRGDGAPARPPGPVSLFAMMLAQSLPVLAADVLVLVPIARGGLFDAPGAGRWVAQAAWVGMVAWFFIAQAVLLWRSSSRRRSLRAFGVGVLGTTLAANIWLWPVHHWYPSPGAEANAQASDEWRLTQEAMEEQPRTLQRTLDALSPSRRDVIDVYAITFAPYAEEDVFRRESDMVTDVMKTRFGAQDRALQLVNHRDTVASLPWATPLNLQRAIDRIAGLMHEEDVLFIHLTSHGARGGALSASFWPMHVEAVTPQRLRQWLDDAGVRHRVVSVSACYSGSWIAPLSSDDTLVLTAADADHTSYGCGRGSELTYFGRAMYHEQLRSTWSFEDAHASARTIIQQRETEAGKKDGYSNPQISVGERMRPVLRALQAQRAADSS